MKLTIEDLGQLIKEELSSQRRARTRENLHEIWPFGKKKGKDGPGDPGGNPETQEKKTASGNSQKSSWSEVDKYLDLTKDALVKNLESIEARMEKTFSKLYDMEELVKGDDKVEQSWGELESALSSIDVALENLKKFVNTIGLKTKG